MAYDPSDDSVDNNGSNWWEDQPVQTYETQPKPTPTSPFGNPPAGATQGANGIWTSPSNFTFSEKTPGGQFGGKQDPTQYPDPQSLLIAQLNQLGDKTVDASGMVGQANQRFGLGTGTEAVAYAGRGPGGSTIYGLPTGYISKNPTTGVWEFTLRGPEGGANPGPTGGGPGPTAGPGPGGPGGGNTYNYTYNPAPYQPSQIMKDPRADALFNMLMARAQQSLKIDPNDPIIRAQSDAYSANTTRSGRQYLQGLAEKQGANANIGSEGRMVAEKGAQAGAAFEGQLLQNELQARRTEIQQALAGAAGLLTAQQQMMLQEELAQLDHAQQLYEFQYGQKQQQSQFDSNLLQRQNEFSDNMSQRAYEFDSTDRFRNSPLASSK